MVIDPPLNSKKSIPTMLSIQKIDSRIEIADTSTSLSIIVVLISKYVVTVEIKLLTDTDDVSTRKKKLNNQSLSIWGSVNRNGNKSTNSYLAHANSSEMINAEIMQISRGNKS